MPLTNYILKYLSQSFLVLKFVFPWSLFRHEMISTSKDLFQFAQVQKGHGVNITTEYQTAEVFGVMYSEKKIENHHMSSIYKKQLSLLAISSIIPRGYLITESINQTL